MDVLQVAWEYPPRLYGGLGRHVHALTESLAELGHTVGVLTPGLVPPRILEPPTPPGVSVVRATEPNVVLPGEQWIAGVLDANAAMVRAALSRWRQRSGVVPAVIHVHDWMAAQAALTLAEVWQVPVVATIHATERGRHQGHIPPGISPWIDAQERRLVALADRVAVCSDYMADHVHTHLREREAGHPPIDVIPNGVDATVWDVRRRVRRNGGSRVRTSPARTKVVFAGRLEYEKGVHVLLDSAHTRPWDVVIAGAGTQGHNLREEAVTARRTGKNGARVRFVGHLTQPALAALLSSADVAVVPSLYEPFGLAALEAMAAGVPVVATAVGGLPEVVQPGSGLLVPPSDPDSLGRAITRTGIEPGLAGTLVRAGHARVGQLTWDRAATCYARIYHDLAG